MTKLKPVDSAQESATGEEQDSWEDTAGTAIFDPGVDPKSAVADTSSGDDSYSGETDSDLSVSGTQSDFEGTKDAGLESESIVDGEMTSTLTELEPNGPGSEIVTTLNPDGTQVVDTYANGNLTDEKTLGVNGAQITDTTYGYDALGRNDSITDSTGTTTFELRADGSVSEIDYPDGTNQVVQQTDAKSDTPTQVKLPDGSTQSTGINTQGQQTSQSGQGVLPAEFTYDPNTGALTGMKLFQSGTLDSGTPESTTWAYDPTTGLLTSKTFNDGTSDTYTYNSKSQLTQVAEPFVNILNNYDNAGRQVSSTATDNVSGISVTDTVGGYDDQGRPTSQTQITTDAPSAGSGQAGGGLAYSNTNAYTYTPQGDLASETQAGDVTTVYTYYPTTGFGLGGAPDALESVKVVQGTTTFSETDYTYDPVTKRIATVTVNGQTFTYSYKNDTNLISSVSSGDVSTAFGYQSNNDNLLSITASDSETNLFSAGYTYNADQQRQTESVTQANPDGSSSTQDQTYGYDAALELNSVTDTNTQASIFSATYDGAGNRNDSSFTTTYGSANGMNQYSDLVYNSRGDLVNDGTLAYAWDAKDELTSEMPDNPSTGSTEEEFQYDASGRRTEEDIFNWNGTTGQSDAEADKVLKFIYQGSNLVAELNGANQLITSLTYGAGTSLLAVTDWTGSSPKTYEVIQDGSGSVVALVDPTTGAVDASFQYSPTGIRTYAAGPAVNVCPYGFAGLIFDGSGLDYYGWHRYYSPQQGRWISPDPIAEAGGLNTREYANNDPINQNDVTGLAAGDEPGASQLWNAAKFMVAHPKAAASLIYQEVQPKIAQEVKDIAVSQATPAGRLAFNAGFDAGEVRAGAHAVTSVLEANETGEDAISWLLSGNTSAAPVTGGLPRHFLTKAVDSALDSANEDIRQIDPGAFDTGQGVGQAEFQFKSLFLSAALPFAEVGAAGALTEAAPSLELLAAPSATSGFTFDSAAAAGLEAAIPLPAIQDAAVESQLITADDLADLPSVNFSASKYPELADNIRNAQLAGHPDVLTYGGNAAANRAAALQDVPNISPLSRDEYPFASSMEGGEGAWVGHIPKAQQNAQGGILKYFYEVNNIQPGDQFRVTVELNQ